ncbi:DUF6886 family protein [Lysinibacillus sp. CTST325]
MSRTITCWYYTSEAIQYPIAKFEVANLFEEMVKRNVELRLVDSLWNIHDEIQKTTLNWSMCRMRFAQQRK